ncbi:MAG: 16S rRNA (guanine(966)-N(2))-methyltransferase RsmD [Lysobacteraceae bacterium]
MTGNVRIIGGRWRGSRLPVADVPGLRPSSDRVRETLFNWLQPIVHGARCLDLFAGSGALGLEAASRGAASVLLIERERLLVDGLRASVGRLQGAVETVEVLQADALHWLSAPSAPTAQAGPFDLAFLDPPFASDHWASVFAQLPSVLAAQAWVYIEAAVDNSPTVPTGWHRHREGRTRDVRYALYRVNAAADE